MARPVLLTNLWVAITLALIAQEQAGALRDEYSQRLPDPKRRDPVRKVPA